MALPMGAMAVGSGGGTGNAAEADGGGKPSDAAIALMLGVDVAAIKVLMGKQALLPTCQRNHGARSSL